VGDIVRCATCEEPIDVLDYCEPCRVAENRPERGRTKRIGNKPKRTGVARLNTPDFDPSPCMRGHSMVWRVSRWRCNDCEAIYQQRKRDKAREHARTGGRS